MYIGEAQKSSWIKNMSPKDPLLNSSKTASTPSSGFTVIKTLPKNSSSSLGVLSEITRLDIVLIKGVVGDSSRL